MQMARQTRKKLNKSRKNVISSVTHIKSTFNNTIITITDLKGETITWCSSGASGFKGTKKSTPFAAQTAAEKVARLAIDYGIKQTEVLVNGPGNGRETAIRALQANGIEISQKGA